MKIEFLGAAGEVTGSCYLITIGESRLLLDCGLIQGAPQDEARNAEPFPFDPRTLDAVILSHAHLDHSGRLPLLVKAGFRGPIYTHRASRDLCRIMLKDAAYINEKEVEWDNRKRERQHKPLLEPLYDTDDALAALQQFRPLEYGERKTLLPGVTVCLRDAGHILGSAIIELWLIEGGVSRKLVYSGDLGQHTAPLLRDPELVQEADLVLIESTYGNRLHRPRANTLDELSRIFAEVDAARGNILIPAFAVGRTQDLLYLMHQHYRDWNIGNWQVFLDSPMAIETTAVYRRHIDLYDRETQRIYAQGGDPLKLPNLHLSHTANQSMKINRIRSGAVIIAGSGMCNGGRIKHHFKHNLWRRNCAVIMVGFQARGTLGRRLVDGAKEITLWGEPVRVAASIHTVGGLSAHADRDGLQNWLKGFANHPAIALVHGEAEIRASFAAHLTAAMPNPVLTPAIGDAIDLQRL